MRKIKYIVIVVMLCLTGCSDNPDTSSLSTYIFNDLFTSKIEERIADSKYYLDKIVVLPNTEYDELEAQNMIDRLSHINKKVLKKLSTKGISIKFVNTKITEADEYKHLAGQSPRGWEDTPYTWEDVPGASGDSVVVRIGYSFPSESTNHGSIILELHETAHAIDRYVFDSISSTDEFIAIQNTEKEILFSDNTYFDYAEEYFAETFAMYTYNDESLNTLKENAPQTFHFYERIIANLN